MDIIPWVIGFIAGLTLTSLRTAAAVGVASSIALRAYQYFLTDPRVRGQTFPEDLFGATAMLIHTAAFAWIGSVIGIARRNRRLALRAES